MQDRIDQYNWQHVGGAPSGDFATFTTIAVPSIYSDVCKQEQMLADTLQQTRLVAQVADPHDPTSAVIRYHICTPNPHSPHRMR